MVGVVWYVCLGKGGQCSEAICSNAKLVWSLFSFGWIHYLLCETLILFNYILDEKILTGNDEKGAYFFKNCKYIKIWSWEFREGHLASVCVCALFFFGRGNKCSGVMSSPAHLCLRPDAEANDDDFDEATETPLCWSKHLKLKQMFKCNEFNCSLLSRSKCWCFFFSFDNICCPQTMVIMTKIMVFLWLREQILKYKLVYLFIFILVQIG